MCNIYTVYYQIKIINVFLIIYIYIYIYIYIKQGEKLQI